jgi:hypothetical protein
VRQRIGGAPFVVVIRCGKDLSRFHEIVHLPGVGFPDHHTSDRACFQKFTALQHLFIALQ